jgi:hypothetical protein
VFIGVDVFGLNQSNRPQLPAPGARARRPVQHPKQVLCDGLKTVSDTDFSGSALASDGDLKSRPGVSLKNTAEGGGINVQFLRNGGANGALGNGIKEGMCPLKRGGGLLRLGQGQG